MVGGVVHENTERIVHSRIFRIERGQVLDRGRALLAQDRRVVAGRKRRLYQRCLTQKPLAEMNLHVAQDAVVLEEGDRGAEPARHRKFGEQGVSVVTRVAKIMAGGDR